MNRDWMIWQLYMDDPIGLSQVEKIQELREHMPTNTDVEEAVTALDRIQNTYGLKVSHIAHGLLNGKQYKYVRVINILINKIIKLYPLYSVSFTALDTYAMGQILFDQENYLAAASWLYQSIVLMEVYKLPAPLELSKNEVQMLYAETLLKLSKFGSQLKYQ